MNLIFRSLDFNCYLLDQTNPNRKFIMLSNNPLIKQLWFPRGKSYGFLSTLLFSYFSVAGLNDITKCNLEKERAYLTYRS